VFTPYVSVGYTGGKSNMGLLGNYELEDGSLLTDPINFEEKMGTMRASVGGTLKLFVLTLHAEYTFQEYNLFSAGVGISVR
jgi:hypothetical protein